MRAAVLTGAPHELRLDDVATPEPESGEVIVRVDACGICGSDLHIAEMGMEGPVLGHEIAGTIESLGPSVDPDTWVVGRSVAVRPTVGCHRCHWCDQGRPDHCAQFGLIGLDRFGGFAEHVAVPTQELYRLPATVTGPEQALVEPLAVARQTLRRAAIAPGENVLVIGGGPIGLAVTAWAKVLGADQVLVSEPVEVRRRLAQTMGADHVIDPTQDDLTEAVTAHLGGPPPLVIECAGSPGRIGEAMEQAGARGRVVVVALLLAPDTIVPWFGLQKELDVRFAMYYDPVDFTDSLDALDTRAFDAAAMITDTVPLDELPDRFARMGERPDAGKVVLTP
ncbi:MAG: alcohol dehydrogenase catalytic domain-containing protein [Acidimicrobiia bacterium]|nr:alcohol dehydrogenase catalytic domain-containing protein [Acidimicrobiia bacterium]